MVDELIPGSCLLQEIAHISTHIQHEMLLCFEVRVYDSKSYTQCNCYRISTRHAAHPVSMPTLHRREDKRFVTNAAYHVPGTRTMQGDLPTMPNAPNTKHETCTRQ